MQLSRRNTPRPGRTRWRRSLVGLVLAAAALSLAAASDAAPRRGGGAMGWRGGGAAGYRGGYGSRGQMGRAPGGMQGYGAGRMAPGGWAGRSGSGGQHQAIGGQGGQSGASRFTGGAGSGRASTARAMLGHRAAMGRGAGQFGRGGSRAATSHWRNAPLPGQRGFTGVPPVGERRFIQNEMVLHIGADVAPETVQGVATRLGLTQVGYQRFDLVGRGLYRFRINDGRSVSDVIRAMEAEKITATAQPNYVFHLQQDLNAARRNTPAGTQGYQYILAKWRLPDVHRVATGRGVLVAMIDSEVDQRHPDIAGAIADRLEPIGQEFKPQPHGTGMAGAMASHRRLIGVAPNARILAVNAFGTDSDSAYGTTEQILKGIDWAIAKGAKVINMSFAGPRDPLVQLALKKAYEKGIVLVAAAGNAGPNSEPLFPAADPDVIAVTATDVNDALLQQANRGSHISVAAPGVDVLVPAPNAQYQLTTGTSVAAAEVSGVIALMLERRPDADPDSIRRALQSTAKDLGTRGRDDDFGWGLVDPYLAMLALDNPSLANARPPAPAPQQ